MVKFEEADAETQSRSAFKVMIAYERWLQSAGPERQRELALLRLTGLFDRPNVRRDCLQALRAEPAIPGLTDGPVREAEGDAVECRHQAARRHRLAGRVDEHDRCPSTHSRVFRQTATGQSAGGVSGSAFVVFFDHLCKNTPYRPDGMVGLGPLYQAVVHGCLAERH